jgi:hypothetical protein
MSEPVVKLKKHPLPEQSCFDTIWRLEPCAELRCLRSMRRPDLHACNQCHPVNIAKNALATHVLSRVRPDDPSSSACWHAQARWQISEAAEVMLCPKNSTSNLK